MKKSLVTVLALVAMGLAPAAAQQPAPLTGTLEKIGQSGYRLAFNVGDDAGMTIPHLHLHCLGGRTLGAEG